MQKAKVTIVCPWWRRWEIVQQHCKSMKRFIDESPSWVKLNYLAVISREDPDYLELIDLCHSFGFTASEYRNTELGNKLNAGINTALKLYKPDYIMNMGSDDLCSAIIWKEYEPYMKQGMELIGIDSVYIIEHQSRKVYYLNLYNYNFPVGVLRMIKTSAIIRLRDGYNLPLYHPGLDQGLDTASMNRLIEIGVKPTVIHTARRPLTCGVKCNVSINHFIHLSTLDMAEEASMDEIKTLLP